MDSGTDLALDLLWFFLGGNSWKPEMYPGEKESMELIALKLPCVLSFITDVKNRDTDQVKNWQTEVRDLMKKMGFYSGNFKSRNDDYYAKKLKEQLIFSKDPTGAAAHIFVYTDVGLNADECKKASVNDYTKARCAYANEAIARSKKTSGGISIGIGTNEGLPELWDKMRKKTKNKKVKTIQFFDHGGPDQQAIGGDRLTADSNIPKDIGSRFASGAEITFYGCSTQRGKMDQALQQSKLATHTANRLLTRGGKVVGFKTKVELDKKDMKVNEPKAEDRVEFLFSACNGANVMGEIILLMRGMKEKFKVKYAQVMSEKNAIEAMALVLPEFIDYPDDYPNSGYYA